MTSKLDQIRFKEEALPEGKEQFLVTGGGKITCLRCTAQSSRTKKQCGRPALKTSRTQKCQFHGGRPHSAETLNRIANANTVHGQSSKHAKQEYRLSIELIHELQDAMRVLQMGSGTRIRGPKPKGYRPINTMEDVVKMIQKRLLNIV